MTPEERRAAAELFRATGQRPVQDPSASMQAPEAPEIGPTTRARALRFFADYWWVLSIAALVGAWLTDIPILRFGLWAAGIPILLLIALPVLLYAFSPLFGLFEALLENFSSASPARGVKRWFWTPLSLIAATAFVLAQVVLVGWSFIVAFVVWEDVVGDIVAIIAMLFLGLAPIAMVLAPFVALVRDGWASFAAIGVMLVMTVLWPLMGRIAFSEEEATLTIEGALGYSPQLFLLGAVGFQVLALALFTLGSRSGGEAVAGIGGGLSLLLALIAAISWTMTKRRLNETARVGIYRASVWVYVLGFFVTTVLAAALAQFTEELATITWLNMLFLLGIGARAVSRLLSGRRSVASA